MLINLFIDVLNLSISAALAAALLMVWRGITRRAIPVRFYYILWVVLLLRLLVPFQFSSRLSLFNPLKALSRREPVAQTDSYTVTMEYLNADELLQAQTGASTLLRLFAILWLAGVVVLFGWRLVVWLLNRRQFRYAVLFRSPIVDQVHEKLQLSRRVPVYTAPYEGTPLTMGILHPRIILPQRQCDTEGLPYVLAHELTHVRRRDVLLKLLWFAAVAVHWYNPLIWLADRMFCADVEESCDQAVVQAFGLESRHSYASTLLYYASNGRTPPARVRAGATLLAQPAKRLHGAFHPGRKGSADAVRIRRVVAMRPISPALILLFTAITLLIGLMVSTNPVLEQNRQFTPKTVLVSAERRQQVEAFAQAFAEAINTGDAIAVAESSTADAAFFLPLYAPFEDSGLQLAVEKIYHTSQQMATVFFRVLANDGTLFPADTETLVADIGSSSLTGGLYVDDLHPRQRYDDIHSVDAGDEAVQIVELMLRLDLTSGGNTAENAARIAAFCTAMSAQRTGLAEPAWLPAQQVEEIAYEFFLIEDMTHLHGCEYYDAQQAAYRFDPGTGTHYEHRIIGMDKTAEGATVTVEFYYDPLQTQTEKIVKYTLERA